MKLAKRIMLVTEFSYPVKGGIETYVHSLAQHLSRNFHVVVVTHGITTPEKNLFKRFAGNKKFNSQNITDKYSIVQLTAYGFKKYYLLPLLIWEIPLIRKFYPNKIFSGLYKFYKLAFTKSLENILLKTDMVHIVSTGYLSVLATEVGIKLNRPVVSNPPIHFGRWGDSSIEMKALTNANIIISFTNPMKSMLKKKLNVDSIVIPPAVIINNTVQPYKHTKPYAFFLARKEKHKGIYEVITTFKEIPSLDLIIAGPGTELKNLPENIIDKGEISEKEKSAILKGSEFFILPTKEESFGLVFTEAMAHSKAIVAYDIVPVNEIIKKECGILVPPNDLPALKKAVLKLCNEKETSNKLGGAGHRRYLENYSIDHTVKEITAVYKTVMTIKNKNATIEE